MGDSNVGLHARMMSKAMRKLTAVISKTDTIAVFINQIREKVGIMFGNPETTTGGRALKFYATIRLEVRKGEALKLGTDVIGNRVKVKVSKNKVAPPFHTAEFDLIYGEGFSRFGSLIDMGLAFDLLTRSGAHYSYNGVKLGNGRENAKRFLAEHLDLADDLESKIREISLASTPIVAEKDFNDTEEVFDDDDSE